MTDITDALQQVLSDEVLLDAAHLADGWEEHGVSKMRNSLIAALTPWVQEREQLIETLIDRAYAATVEVARLKAELEALIAYTLLPESARLAPAQPTPKET